MTAQKLSLSQVYHFTDPQSLPENLSPLSEILGQTRAKKAIEFALSVSEKGYNIFAIGENGLGKRTMMLRYLRQQAAPQEPIFDWCYVANFEHSRHPNVLCLPQGMANQFKKKVENSIRELVKTLPLAFDNEWYFRRAAQLKTGLNEQQEQRLKKLTEYAKKHDVVIQLTEEGDYQLMALREDGQAHTEHSFDALSSEDQKKFEKIIDHLEMKLRTMVRSLSEMESDYIGRLQKLNEEVASEVIDRSLVHLLTEYEQLPKVIAHLNAMKADILVHLDLFVAENPDSSALTDGIWNRKMPPRYQINVLSSFEGDAPFPVIVEENPSYHKLFGYVEKATLQGTVFSDFTLIRAGSLHLANGGVLLMDAIKVLECPFVWDGLKRALHRQKLSLTALEQEIALSGNISLDPMAIPLNVKIVLFGDALTYRLLQHYDAEFCELFRITAQFDDQMSRTTETEQQYAQFLVGIMSERNFLSCDRTALARVIEYSSRQANDQRKLSLHSAHIANVLRESHYIAKQAQSSFITAEHIDAALIAQKERVNCDQTLILTAIDEAQWLLSFDGDVIGQVNGLSVVGSEDHRFGLVNRITAAAWQGDGAVLDIERQCRLGGTLHSKGVAILSSYLKQCIGRNRPLTMNISLTFEQSYGEIDGDSASLAECCAILSCLSGIPIDQSWAITGSMNQLGDVQPIGGINEKLEGFFQIGQTLQVNHKTGVIFPKSNMRHLMLNKTVRALLDKEKIELITVSHLSDVIPFLFREKTLNQLLVCIQRRWFPLRRINPDRLSR